MNRTDNYLPKILVIEDDPDLREAIVSYFNLENLPAVAAANLEAADKLMEAYVFDILVLDLSLPDGDGLDWLSGRRDLADKGVVITTARGSGNDRLHGIKAGSDAYLVKPVQLEELALIVQRLATRLAPPDAPWVLDALSWQLISPSGGRIKLTSSETKILHQICNEPGQVIARHQIIEALGYSVNTYDPRRLEILVRRLRNKAKKTLSTDLPLESVYSRGYSFIAPVRLRA